MTRSHRIGAGLWAVAAMLLSSACTDEFADPLGDGSSPAAADAPTVEDAPAAKDAPAAPEDAFVEADAAAAACGRDVSVATTAQLGAAIAGAQAGDCITLADGSYSFDAIRKKGTAAAPILITARNRGKAKVTTGNLVLDGASYVTVEGLLWTSSGNVRISNADHCRITRFTFHPQENEGTDWISVSGRSDATRIDHNELGPKNVLSNMIMLSGAGGQIVKNTRIDHNYFHDINASGGNGWEAIRAGLSGLALSSGHTVIEYNLFERCDGDPETISIKSSDAIVRFNTLRANAGEITLRHGNRTQVHGNFILGENQPSTGGIRVCGQDHKIFNNYIQDITGSAIFLEGGDSDAMNEAGTAHYRVYRAQVVNNTIVGAKGIANGGAHPFEPVDSVIANNLVQGPSGSLYKEHGTVHPTYQGNLANPTGGTSIGMTATAAQVRKADPKLARVGQVRKLTAVSPAIDTAVGSFPYVTKDIDGETRGSAVDVGADEYSAQAGRKPLLPADVGPNAP